MNIHFTYVITNIHIASIVDQHCDDVQSTSARCVMKRSRPDLTRHDTQSDCYYLVNYVICVIRHLVLLVDEISPVRSAQKRNNFIEIIVPAVVRQLPPESCPETCPESSAATAHRLLYAASVRLQPPNTQNSEYKH